MRTHRPGVVLAAIALILLSSLHLAGAATAVPIHEVPAGTAHHWTDADPQDIADYGAAAVQAWIDAYWRQVWIDTVNFRRWMAAAAERERVARLGPPYVDGILVCNGIDLPTCGIVRRESGFNPRARNRHSTAGGLYQFLASTFRSVCPAAAARWGNAANAPVSVQVDCVRVLWAGGAGWRHWRLTA